MSPISGLNGIVWMLSIVLAVVFLAAGLVKAYRYEMALRRMAWVQDASRELVRFVGLMEAVCGVGLVLPVATGYYPWLTTVAASTLTLIQLLAIGFNAKRKDTDEIVLNVLLLVFLLIVFYGRLGLLETL